MTYAARHGREGTSPSSPEDHTAELVDAAQL
jgi:hypothetical protein